MANNLYDFKIVTKKDEYIVEISGSTDKLEKLSEIIATLPEAGYEAYIPVRAQQKREFKPMFGYVNSIKIGETKKGKPMFTAVIDITEPEKQEKPWEINFFKPGQLRVNDRVKVFKDGDFWTAETIVDDIPI